MKPFLILATFLALATAQELPPLPPDNLGEVEAVDTNKVFVLVFQPRPATYRLQWNQSNAPFVHSWRIYTSTNLPTNLAQLKFYLQTVSTNVFIPIDAPQRFFVVTAIGTNGIESLPNGP